eukprot:11020943-Alexandrium_andersonii.AAC.1
MPIRASGETPALQYPLVVGHAIEAFDKMRVACKFAGFGSKVCLDRAAPACASLSVGASPLPAFPG